MRSVLLAAAVVAALGARAAADDPTFPETLTKDEIRAAADAAQAALPPVDKAVSAECKALPFDTTAQLAVAATCYRSAGALGAAIVMWQRVIQLAPRTTDAKLALDALGRAYEAAGLWDQSARTRESYAKKYAGEPDARDQMIRAVCIRRQLGDVDLAVSGFKYVAKAWRKQKVASATLCDAIRPIVVPPPATQPAGSAK